MMKQRDIISSLQFIQANSLNISQQVGMIKNTFMQAQKRATDIKIMYSSTVPSIYVQYKINGKIIHQHIKEFVQTKAFKAHPYRIAKVYQKLYKIIEFKYQNLLQFGLQKAVDLNMKNEFTYNSVIDLQKNNYKKHMFYYCRKDGIIGFSLFNINLLNVEFDSLYIESLKNYLKKEFIIYQQFLKYYFPFVQNQQQQSQKYAQSNQKFNQKPYQEKTTKNYQNQKRNHQKKGQNKNERTNKKPQNSDKKQTRKKKYNTKIQQNQQNQKNILSNQSTPIEVIRSKLNKILSKDLRTYDQKSQKLSQKLRKLDKQSQLDPSKIPEADLIYQQAEQINSKIHTFQKVIGQIKEDMKYNGQNKKYVRMNLKKAIIAEKQLDSQLPIVAKKQIIFQKLRKNSLLILEGETGSGKSTQLPQFLCQFYNLFDDDKSLPVLITQPRKLSTKTLAQRVAFQIQQKTGGFVDYVSSIEKTYNKNAKILFKLDRLVLDDLSANETLSGYSCLVLDEAHERTLNIDIIVGLITNLLNKRNDFKIIITSASMDVQLFQRYFKSRQKNFKFDIIKVPGRMYPVKIQYKNYPSISDTQKKIEKVIDQEILKDINSMKNIYQGHVLAFCTGVDQINRLVDKYTSKLNKHCFKVYPLHGSLNSEEQDLVFEKIKEKKIIFCTRIAETAITIQGVSVVIDPGVDWMSIYNQKNKISSKQFRDISQSAAKQRTGRAGRTSSGFCFRLYSQAKFKELIPSKIPQIQNNALEIVILRLKSLKLKNVKSFPFISPPDSIALQLSQQLLKMIGALQQDGTINSIGRLLVRIPIEPFLSRAIAQSLIYEHILGQTNGENIYLQRLNNNQLKKVKKYTIWKSVIQILCMIVNAYHLFYIREQNRQLGDQTKFQQFSSQKGDFFFLRNIYDTFDDCFYSQKTEGKMKKFLNKYFLSYKALNEAKNLFGEISAIVNKQSHINFRGIGDQVLQKCRNKIKKCNNYEQLVLSCLLSSFCANLCLYSGHPDIGYTLLSEKFPIQIYGSSSLSLQGITPKWIVGYDLMKNQTGRLYCKIAHEVKQQFLQQMVQQYIWDRFKMKQLLKKNPFYIKKQFDLPTCLYQKIYQDYLIRKQFKYFNFLNEIEVLFTDSRNKIVLFVYLNNQNQKFDKIKRIDQYLQSVWKNAEMMHKYNYVGDCKILFDKQFQINSITFKTEEIIYEIDKLNMHMYHLVYNTCFYYGRMEFITNTQIRIYLQEEEKGKDLQNQLEALRAHGNLKVSTSKIFKKRNTPQIYINLYFFAGVEDKKEVILQGYDENIIQTHIQHLRQAINICKHHKTSYKNIKIGDSITGFYETKNKTGIRVYTELDQFNIEDIIEYLYSENILNNQFIFPKGYIKFRSISFPEGQFTDEQWKNQIYFLMDKLKIIKQDYVLNVFENNRQQVRRNRNQQERLNMVAVIRTYNQQIYQKLMAKYDDKTKVVGLDKVHVRKYYTFIAAKTSQNVYKILQNKMNNILQDYRQKGFQIQLKFDKKYVGIKQMWEINLSSSYKSYLFQPLKQIRKLFMAKKIKLTALQFQILKNKAQQIFHEVINQYNNEIYFQFSMANKQVYMYCEQGQEKAFESSLHNQINGHQINEKFISYKGRNLNQIIEILDIKKKNDSSLNYEISFKNRQIILKGKVQIIDSCIKKINDLNENQHPSCSLCQDQVKIPYTLCSCKCTFCWSCLANYLRQIKLKLSDQINCPYCDKAIFLQDLKLLIAEDEFAQLCDLKVKQYIKQNEDRYVACTNCDQIFEVEGIEAKELNCQLCGNVYTLQIEQEDAGNNLIEGFEVIEM